MVVTLESDSVDDSDGDEEQVTGDEDGQSLCIHYKESLYNYPLTHHLDLLKADICITQQEKEAMDNDNGNEHNASKNKNGNG